jgi:hypothetical protein
MKSRLFADCILIVVIYAVFAAVVVLATQFNLPEIMDVRPGKGANTFLDDFQNWAFVSVGVSFLATVFWYVIGEWGPAPSAGNQGSSILIWLIGLILSGVGGILGYFYGPQPQTGLELLVMFYVGSAIFFYYLATMLFSPVNVKYVVPGTKLFRKW